MQYTSVGWAVYLSIGWFYATLIHYSQPLLVRMTNKDEDIMGIVSFPLTGSIWHNVGSDWHTGEANFIVIHLLILFPNDNVG